MFLPKIFYKKALLLANSCVLYPEQRPSYGSIGLENP